MGLGARAAADIKEVVCSVVGEAGRGSSGDFVGDERHVGVADAASYVTFRRAGGSRISVCVGGGGMPIYFSFLVGGRGTHRITG